MNIVNAHCVTPASHSRPLVHASPGDVTAPLGLPSILTHISSLMFSSILARRVLRAALDGMRSREFPDSRPTASIGRKLVHYNSGRAREKNVYRPFNGSHWQVGIRSDLGGGLGAPRLSGLQPFHVSQANRSYGVTVYRNKPLKVLPR